jgi:FdhE protein
MCNMVMSQEDRQVLNALTAARAAHQELADLLDFYADLFFVQFEAKARVPEPELRDEVARRWRLEGGIPQLTFPQLGIEPGLLAEIVDEVLLVLRRHNPGWEESQQDQEPAQLVALAQRIYDTWETLTSPGAAAEGGDEAWSQDHPRALAVGFALVPYLTRAAEAIVPHLDLAEWHHGYCPVCGGRPNLALLDEERGARRLLCSRCNSLWNYGRTGCPFCRSREKQIYYPSDDNVYRLYTCPDCKRYLKTVDLRELHREVVPVVERLVTVGMDLAAQQEGFRS